MILDVILSQSKHQKHIILTFIACSMLLVLSGCRIPNLRGSESGPALPAGFDGVPNPDGSAASTENSAQLGVEEFYNDPKLTGLVQQAMVNNRELKILDEEIQIALNEIQARRGAYLPFVTVGAGAGLDKSSRFTREEPSRIS